MPLAGRNLPYRQGYDYGIGLIATTGMRCSQGVQGEVSGVQGAEGGVGTLKITRVETTEDLESSLGISAEATGGVGLFAASARFDFARECQIHSQALTLLVAQTVQFGFQQIDIPVLRDPAKEVAERPELFQSRYGDLFVAGIGSGGLFVGVLKIEYRSEQSRQTIEAAMSGSYGLAFSAEVATKLQNALTQTNSSVRVYVHAEGGTLLGHEHPMTPAELLAAHGRWYESIVGPDGKGTDLKRPYFVQALPYAVAEGPPPPNEQDLQRQLDVLARCATLRSTMLDNLNLVTYVLAHPDQYEFAEGTVAYLQDVTAALGRDLQQISETASHATNHPGDAQWPEVFKAPEGGYRFTVLDPARMPKRRDSVEVKVPDLRSCGSTVAARKQLTDLGLTLQLIVDATREESFRVLSQTPPPNTAVAPGSVVALTIPKSPFNLMIEALKVRGNTVRQLSGVKLHRIGR